MSAPVISCIKLYVLAGIVLAIVLAHVAPKLNSFQVCALHLVTCYTVGTLCRCTHATPHVLQNSTESTCDFTFDALVTGKY